MGMDNNLVMWAVRCSCFVFFCLSVNGFVVQGYAFQ